jgi:hypothetical protein
LCCVARAAFSLALTTLLALAPAARVVADIASHQILRARVHPHVGCRPRLRLFRHRIPRQRPQPRCRCVP